MYMNFWGAELLRKNSQVLPPDFDFYVFKGQRLEYHHIYSHVMAPGCHCLKTRVINECSLTRENEEALGLLTRNHRGRSLYRLKVGTWAWGCCIRTPRSQSHPFRIPWGIVVNSIFPGRGRNHLKELRKRSFIAVLTIHQRWEVAAGQLAATFLHPALTAVRN